MGRVYLDMQDIFLEVPVMIISLLSLPIVLNDIYKQYYKLSAVRTKKTLFIMQFMSSSMWIILGVMNKQWFMLLLATNNILQTMTILYYIHRINSSYFEVNEIWHFCHSVQVEGRVQCATVEKGIYSPDTRDNFRQTLKKNLECTDSMRFDA